MNVYGAVVLGALVGEYALSLLASTLTLRALDPQVPARLADVVDAERYARSQEYTRVTTRFGLIRGGFNLLVILAFWWLGGFEATDRMVRAVGYGPVGSGLLFVGVLGLASTILGLPFRLYRTFVIEARFGFNRTTPATFVTDLVKGLVLGALLGGVLLAGVLFFFEWAGPGAWLWCWGGTALFSLSLQLLAPTWILPLFNTFTPLDAGELRDRLLAYARSVDFPLADIFVVDGSKRSSKANAFFTGLGRTRRIGLFDTLVDKYSVDELVAVVAHEVGHHKRGHLVRGTALQMVYLGLLFFVLSLVIGAPGLHAAFHMTEVSVYAGLVFFGLLFTPVELVLSLGVHAMSRRHEFEADAFAAETTGDATPLVTALEKLSSDSLSNFTPHPLEVALRYSHPPVLQRIAALQALPLAAET